MSDATRKVARGAGWLYAYRWIERLLDFLSVVVLARLLSPDDFGLVAIAASFVTIIEGLAAFDVNKALIRLRDDDRALFDSAWTLSLMRGVLAALIMAAVAPWLQDARLGAVLLVLALGPVLHGLMNPRFVAFERELLYSKVAGLTLGARVGSVAVTLVVAWVARSYWALVAGMLVGSLLSMVLSYALRPYRPRFDLSRWRDIFGFSGWLSLTSVVTTLSMETDKLIVGRLLGVADAGYYFMTQRLGVLPTRELISPLQRVLFPSFSALRQSPERLRRVVGESVNVLGTLSLPAGCGFALVAADFVPLVLGERWRAIVPLLTVLVPYLGLRATLSSALPGVLALGQTRLLFTVSSIYACVHLPAFIFGTARFGLRGAIWSIVLAGILYIALNAWMLWRTLGIRPSELLTQLRRPLLATALMVGAVAAWGAYSGVEPGTWLSLVSRTLVGAGAFTAAIVVLWRLEGRPEGIERRLTSFLSN